jgi:large subunit ribosomal protein L23e
VSCSDTSGCNELKIIGIKKHQGSRRTVPQASVGDMVTAVIHTHSDNTKIGEKVQAIIIQQNKPWHRVDGKLSCEDNAAVLVNESGALLRKRNKIIGPVAKECINLWPLLSSSKQTVV